MPREYSPYVVTQLRGCLVAARAHREAQFEAWAEIGKCSTPFHTGPVRPPIFDHADEARGGKNRRSMIFRAILQATGQRAGPNGVGSYWSGPEEFSKDVWAQLMPKLRECGQGTRWHEPWPKEKCLAPNDEGNTCLLVLNNAFQQGWVKTIFQHTKLEAVRYQALQDVLGEMKKIGYTREAVRAVTKPIANVARIDLLGDVPDTDQGMVDFYWAAMVAAGIEGRMTLHKAMLTYMTENYLKTSKVSLGNWIEHKGY